MMSKVKKEKRKKVQSKKNNCVKKSIIALQ